MGVTKNENNFCEKKQSFITSFYHQIWHPNDRMTLVVSSIVKVSKTKYHCGISVGVDNWTAERAVIASNDIYCKSASSSLIVFSQKTLKEQAGIIYLLLKWCFMFKLNL